ncbi:M48 family metallopeptidase [Paraburkholderia sp. J12]|uniref:M48 family metallopeptidase n=1 Tax=Paraburkholderia sp. J12 TaxID=2805432 RepID=UPI002ABE8834|nr:M48 family metallopeptidase [Paraburkholderia sp. J12]
MTPLQPAVRIQRRASRRARRGAGRVRTLAGALQLAIATLSGLHAGLAFADNVPPVATPAAPAAPATAPSGAETPAQGQTQGQTSGQAPGQPTGSAQGSAPGAAQTASAAAAGASGISGAAAQSANRQVRFGNSAVYRNLIPSPMLEDQAAAEYAEIVRGAAHSDRLYPDTDPRVQRVRLFVDRLAPYAQKWSDRVKSWKWEVAVIRSPDIRMYCLPGGKIVVYGGLLDRVKLNDNEFGMLLGHEIAHAVREHMRERLGQQQAAQIEAGTVPQLFGLADLGVFPLGIGTQLFEMHYGHADETEADVIGSDIASRAGFDPRAAVTLWDKLAAATKNDHDQGFIYVHPYTPARRADIIKRLPDMLPLYAKAIGKPVDELPDYAGIGVPQRRKVAAP